MKTFFILIASWLLILPIMAQNEDYVYQKTGLTFPAKTKNLVLEQAKDYENTQKGLGTAARYKHYLFEKSAITLFIYDMGKTDIQDGIATADAKKMFAMADKEVAGAGELLGYSKLKGKEITNRTLSSLSKSRKVLCKQYSYKWQDQDFESLLMLVAVKGHYFKVRLTCLKTDRQKTENAMNELLEIMEKQM
jgi:hypothetical protein